MALATSSPFYPYKNWEGEFQVASGALVQGKNGNWEPGTALIHVIAIVEQAGRLQTKEFPGGDPTAIYYKGTLIGVGEPGAAENIVLPSIINKDSPCAATVGGRSGRWYLDFSERDPYVAALGITLVEEFNGWFIPGSFVVSGEPFAMIPTALYSDLYMAATALSALRVVRVTLTGQIDYASSADATHAFTVLGITTAAIASGSQGRALNEGRLSDTSWNWDTTLPIWLGVDGALTQVAPTTGFLLQVATALTPATIEIEIQEPIFL